MPPSSSDYGDFTAVFLLVSSSRILLTAAIIAQVKLRIFFSFVRLQLRYQCIPPCTLVWTLNNHPSKGFTAPIMIRPLLPSQVLTMFLSSIFWQNLTHYIFIIPPTLWLTRLWEWGSMLSQRCCLDLALGYTRIRGSMYALQVVLGASHSAFCLIIKIFYKVAIQGVAWGRRWKGCSSICTGKSRVPRSC